MRSASPEWVTAACLGQMTFDKAQATTIGSVFELPPQKPLRCCRSYPTRARCPPAYPSIRSSIASTNSSVSGTTIKELIHEEFGDGIMSAIDFKMNLEREPNDAGDRVRIVLSGKSCPTNHIDRYEAKRRPECPCPTGAKPPRAGRRSGRGGAPFKRIETQPLKCLVGGLSMVFGPKGSP